MSSATSRSLVALSLLGAGLAAALAACSGDEGGMIPLPSAGDGSSAAPGASVAARLDADTGVSWIVEMDPRTNTASLAFPSAPLAPVLTAGLDASTVAAEFLARYPEVFGVHSAGELVLEEAASDEDSATHVTLLQTALGEPVTDAVLQVHFARDGSITHVTGPFYPTLAEVAARLPTVDSEVAAQTAIAAVAAQVPTGTVTAQPSQLELHVLAGAPVRVHALRVNAGSASWDVWIDATSGAALWLEPTERTLTLDAAGVNATRSIEIDDPVDGVYRLSRSGGGARSGMRLYDRSLVGTLLWDGLPYSTRDPAQWDGDPSDTTRKGVAVEAYYKLGLADRFYRALGWRSFDGKGSAFDVWVFDADDMPTNAYFDRSGTPSFGFGRGTAYKPAAVSMDAVGHEFTHGVFHHATRATTSCGSELGAIDEAFGDIFGQLISAETVGGDPGLLGEEYGRSSTIRSLRDPAQRASTDNPNITPGTDHVEWKTGRCHLDAGIVNLAWSLMTQGGPHPEPRRGSVPSGIGMAASKKLWWNLLRHQMRGVTTFKALAQRSLSVASSQGGSKQAVGCAWKAVGVLDEKELKSSYGVECPQNDAGMADTCRGKIDGLHCSEFDTRSAFRCRGGSFVGAEYCKTGEHCTSAAGASTLGCAKD